MMSKSLRDYITEAENIQPGDELDIELAPDRLIESCVIESAEDYVVISGDDEIIGLLESHGHLTETIQRYGPAGSNNTIGYSLGEEQHCMECGCDPCSCDAEEDHGQDDGADMVRIVKLAGLGEGDHADPLANKAAELAPVGADTGTDQVTTVDEESMDEAKYQGREVPLGKPMQGDVKKFKVYVKDPKTGNVKKVNFGDKTMRIKKSNPARRRSFRARHRCDNPGPRTKARYWSCRAW